MSIQVTTPSGVVHGRIDPDVTNITVTIQSDSADPLFSPEDLELLDRTCDCMVSCGTAGELTRGSGDLDPNGYWSVECTHTENNRSQKENHA